MCFALFVRAGVCGGGSLSMSACIVASHQRSPTNSTVALPLVTQRRFLPDQRHQSVGGLLLSYVVWLSGYTLEMQGQAAICFTGPAWVTEIGLDASAYDTHTMRRTKASMIYRGPRTCAP
jgi:hypothetical protein